MATPHDPSAPPGDGRCMWDKLSNEIKDIVFDFAYVPVGKFRPFQKQTWLREEEERERREKSRFVPRQFPKPYFAERLLVSKAWCTASLEYFYAHTFFDFESGISVYTFTRGFEAAPPHGQTITGISMPLYATHLELEALAGCPRLKNLELCIDPDFFELSLKKDICIDEWTKADFKTYKESRQILEMLRGISTVTITLQTDGHVNFLPFIDTGKSLRVFESNLEVFRRLVNKWSKVPRPAVRRPFSNYVNPCFDYDRLPALPSFSTGGSYSETYAPTSPPFVPIKGGTPLQDYEIPDNALDFQILMATRADDLFNWVQAAKQERLPKGH